MGEPNIFVSNGTCYSGPGKKLDSSFIPCGNAAFGHYTCCGAGDNCLVDNACWGQHGTGYGSSLTYLAGCTDPEYKDPSCPKKEFGKSVAARERESEGPSGRERRTSPRKRAKLTPSRPTLDSLNALRQQQRRLGSMFPTRKPQYPPKRSILQLHRCGQNHNCLQRHRNPDLDRLSPQINR